MWLKINVCIRCPWSSPARPRTPGSARPAGCRCRWWTSATPWSGWWCCAWWAPSSPRPPSRCPATRAPRRAAASPAPSRACRPTKWPPGRLEKSCFSWFLTFTKIFTHTSSVGHRLVRVDALVQLLAVEVVLEQLLDLGDARGTANQNHVVDGRLVQLGVAQRFVHRLQRRPEQVGVELLETRPCDGRVEIDALEQAVDFDAETTKVSPKIKFKKWCFTPSLGRAGQRAFGTLASRTQAPQRALIGRHVLFVLALELAHKMGDHAVVEILAAQVRVACGRLDFKDAIFDGQHRDVKRAATQVEDEHVAFALTLKGHTKIPVTENWANSFLQPFCPTRKRWPPLSVRWWCAERSNRQSRPHLWSLDAANRWNKPARWRRHLWLACPERLPPFHASEIKWIQFNT